LFETLRTQLAAYRHAQDDVDKLAEAQNDKAAQGRLLAQLEPAFGAAEQTIRKLEDVNRVVAEGSTQQIVAAVGSARSGIYVSLLGALAATVLSAFVLRRSVRRSGVQVDASVRDIAATAKQQQATASEIAATTTEIGSTSHEISATSKVLVRTMNEVA